MKGEITTVQKVTRQYLIFSHNILIKIVNYYIVMEMHIFVKIVYRTI